MLRFDERAFVLAPVHAQLAAADAALDAKCARVRALQDALRVQLAFEVM